uniref:Uncharacterized protein n=1 Tax=uncultured Bdellovibrionales bacterium TaxID=395355 RepID=A0A977XKR1_9BACT|nr:hypothetical protein tmp_000017 [uncultured Bdellovibrionales bacterium]
MFSAVNAILTFYPGSMSVDSWQQFRQATSGKYDDVHPPMMAWVWSWLLWIRKGPQPMLFLNVGMFWTGLFLIWSKLIKEKSKVYFLVPLMGLMPVVVAVVVAMVGVIWKDIALGTSAVLATGILMNHKPQRSMLTVGLVILLFYATAVRHNALTLTLPLFLVLVLTLQGQRPKILSRAFSKSLLRSFFVLGGCLVLIFIVNNWILNTKKSHMYPAFVFIHDLSFIGQRYDLELVPEAFRTGNYSKERVAKALLDKRASDSFIYPKDAPFKIINDTDEISKLIGIWAKNGFLHFPSYLELRTQLFKSINCIGFGQCRACHFYMPKEFGNGISDFTSWRKYLEKTFTRMAATTVIFSGWFYLLIACVGLVITGFLRGQWLVLTSALFVSSVFYNLSFYSTTVSCDFRYLWPPIMLTTIGTILLLDDSTKRIKKLVKKR